MNGPVTRCRVCLGPDFEDVLDLGSTPFADDFLTPDRLREEQPEFPLRLVVCRGCSLVQLSYVAPREALYQTGYPYVSSTTESGVGHYHRMAQDVVSRFAPPAGALSVDIGSNVGVLAEGFQNLGMRAIGVEPAQAIAKMADARGIPTVNEFFSAQLAERLILDYGQASVVTGTNVIAHIDDLHDLMLGVRWLLAPGGVFVFEAPYLLDLLEKCEYDTIYHEHLSYLAVGPVRRLCEVFGLEVFDAEWVPIHGGTLRYFIAARGAYPAGESVCDFEARERALPDLLPKFQPRVRAHRDALVDLLCDLKNQGKRIAAVSAPAKGMTLLNYCGIGADVLDFVTEKAPLKIGKFTPGSRLPVLPDAALVERQPDYALLLAWNFAQEIMANQDGFNGRFIIPIPTPRVA